MYRLQLMLLLMLFAVSPAWAQDDASEPAESAQTDEDEAAPEQDVSDEEIDELLGLDEDYSETEDDDFDPTQAVRFGQSIVFPTDI